MNSSFVVFDKSRQSRSKKMRVILSKIMKKCNWQQWGQKVDFENQRGEEEKECRMLPKLPGWASSGAPAWRRWV